jgi:hypothetical protein
MFGLQPPSHILTLYQFLQMEAVSDESAHLEHGGVEALERNVNAAFQFVFAAGIPPLGGLAE